MSPALPRLQRVLSEHARAGEHTSMLLSVSLGGRVLDWCEGEMAAGQAMTRDVVFPWLSAGKPLTAVALGFLLEAGEVELAQPVARWVPAFAEHGKGTITLAHVLTHTGGFASMFDLDGRASSWDEAVRRVCASRARWAAGERAAYQPRSGWQILGEVVRVVSGVEVDSFVSRHILEPAGLHDTKLWLRHDELPAAGVAPLFDTGTGAGPAITGATPYCSPGAGTCGTVADLRRLYELLLREGTGSDGAQVLQAATVKQLTSHHRAGMVDESFRHVVDWGLGFVLDSNRYGADTVPYGYGRHCSSRTFGHGGSQCCTGFADPEHGLAVALAVNGRPGEAAHAIRFRRALTALYEDLELAHPTHNNS